MSTNRRDFIKFVVTGAIAAGCPIDHALVAEPAAGGARHGTPKVVDGEHNEICHKVRDGFQFQIPPVSKRYDVVIVGGGVSGLTAAYRMKDPEWFLIEKEPHWGGNAYAMDYQGTTFASGAAFMLDENDEACSLAKELGMTLLPIKSWDGTMLKGEYVPDTWGDGIGKLPYAQSVRDSFKAFRDEINKIDVEKRKDELDALPFSHFMNGYAPEIKHWWDGYGPSNWGAMAHETSAYLGVSDLQGNSAADRKTTRNTWPGGNGALTKKLAEVLIAQHASRMINDAAIIAVEELKSEVHVTYSHGGRLTTIAAKAVIMATPKFITARLVKNLPDHQRAAMMKYRYIPYPVVNLVYDKPVFDKGYDTWCPGNAFTDFIVADWTIRHQPDFHPKFHVITCYTPLQEVDRPRLLTDAGAREVAARVLHDFMHLAPEFNIDPVEVHIFRRGHPMFMGTPGLFTKVMPIARQPMKRVFFANTDSEGPLSTSEGGIRAAKRALREMQAALDGKTVGAAASV